MLGIIAGTGFHDARFLGATEKKLLETPHGAVYAFEGAGFLFVQRHGENKMPPHRINHKANIYAFKQRGVKKIISLNSVGSLRKDLPPGTLLVPEDYVCPWSVETYFDFETVHITPRIDSAMRDTILAASRKAGIKAVDGGVYVQTVGPRLETRAEVRMLSSYADVVGMSLASEATLAQEQGLKYASLSAVDNYAHGVVDEELDFRKVVERAENNRGEMKKIVKTVLEARR